VGGVKKKKKKEKKKKRREVFKDSSSHSPVRIGIRRPRGGK
jgi:hypothetical protein